MSKKKPLYTVFKCERGIPAFTINYPDEFFKLDEDRRAVILVTIQCETEALWEETVRELKEKSMRELEAMLPGDPALEDMRRKHL